jgi:NAD(P)-dependent dehydrogenase (short-subunit alcohol dehydrogenase family)
MEDVLGYAGKRVLVTGAASGMGAATVDALKQLGATVIGVDRVPIGGPVDESVTIDLLDGASIDAGLARISGPMDAVFSVAGLPGPPFSDLEVMIVNVVACRVLIEGLVPKMANGAAVACVGSAGGMGWETNIAMFAPLFETHGFADGVTWLEENPDAWSWSGYAASKQAINVWVAHRSATLLPEHGVRLNATNPGVTDTAMLPLFHEANGKELVDAARGPIGRYSSAEEQAWPLIFLNSPRASFVNGESFFTDGGFHGALLTGQVDFSQLLPAE